MIRERRDETRQEVAVREVDLEDVEACLLRHLRRAHEVAAHGVHVPPAHLPEGNWPIIAASPIPYFPYSQVPSGSGSSIPSQARRVEPLRPAWPSWSPIFA